MVTGVVVVGVEYGPPGAAFDTGSDGAFERGGFQTGLAEDGIGRSDDCDETGPVDGEDEDIEEDALDDEASISESISTKQLDMKKCT